MDRSGGQIRALDGGDPTARPEQAMPLVNQNYESHSVGKSDEVATTDERGDTRSSPCRGLGDDSSASSVN